MSQDLETTEGALRGLRTEAPPSLAGRVLTETGLVDAWTTVRGPGGDLFIAHNPEGVSCVAPVGSLGEFADVHASRTGRRLGVEQELAARQATALRRVLATGRPGSLRIDLRGLTGFQRAVLAKTAEIPPGELRPYAWVAREIGNAGAVRAVGSALNRNPVPVVLPCHRVGRSDGSVGDYAFGRHMKRDLLRAEGTDPDTVDELARRGIRFIGSDTTLVYCHPTCRHARRITAAHRVEFRSAPAAAAAGYRSCKTCRPVAAA